MGLRRSLATALAMLWLVHGSPSSEGQPAIEYRPEVGQQGKDVIWVPTPDTLVDKMLDMAKVGPGDVVVDLGSGDGRTVIAAARRGAIAHGIEYNPDMVALSRRRALRAGISGKATFAEGDIFASDFTKASVITMFLLPGLNLKLRPHLLEMAPGTRVVSNSFDMGEWPPDETARVTDGCQGYCRAYLWIVPAKVGGVWTLEADGQTGEIVLQQGFQAFDGMLTAGNVVAPVKDGRLAGDRITFSAGGAQYTGRVQGDAMVGTRTAGGAETRWRAVRK